MAEGSRLPVERDANPQVVVQFEQKDLSVGTARYRDAVPITKNLSMKPGGRRAAATPMIHANVEVQLFNDQRKPVPMTRRLVRTWDVQPHAGASVDNLRQWHIAGLQHSEFSPFSPFPAATGNKHPGDSNFRLDRPGRRDAPGLQFITREPFGILQEFLAGNTDAGGAYFQTYTLFDGTKYRIINSRSMTLSKAEYRELLNLIDSGAYAKSNARQLYFMPDAATDDIGDVPAALRK
jgi:hypothetical protein